MTVKAGVMGWPVAHSLSPRLHGYWLKKYGIDGTYEALAVPPEKLAQELKSLHARGFKGVNITIPHKEAALKIVDHADPASTRAGAVNTVVAHANGTLDGRNTDIYGFIQNLLAAGVKVSGKPAVVLGSGGAARAAIAGLFDLQVSEIRIVNRTPERAQALAALWGKKTRTFAWNNYREAFPGAGILVNTTSLGMQGQPPLSLALDDLPVEAAVADLVYAPLVTGLLKQAQKKGHKTVDGLGMLLYQARPAFQAFFGTDPDVTDELRAYVLEGR